MNVKATLLPLLLSLIHFCCISTDVFIKNTSKKIVLETPKPDCDSFWSALQHFNFNCTFENITKDQAMFVDGLIAFFNKENIKADSIFILLARSSNDSLVKKYSRDILTLSAYNSGSITRFIQFKSEFFPKEFPFEKTFADAGNEIIHYPTVNDTIPISYSSSSTPIIEVSVNGKRKFFWIDTGSSETVLSSEIAEECGVKAIDRVSNEIETLSRDIILYKPAIISKLTIGKTIIENHPIIILDKKYLTSKIFFVFTRYKIDGIIGWRTLKMFKVQFNFKNNFIVFSKPYFQPTASQNLFWFVKPFVKLRTNNGIPTLFFVDLGAEFSSATPNLTTILDKIETSPALLYYKTLGGEKIRIGKKINSLDLFFNSLMVEIKNIPIIPPQDKLLVHYDGVIGMDILKNGNLYLDYSNNIFRLSYE